jgi:hypothetical protein
MVRGVAGTTRCGPLGREGGRFLLLPQQAMSSISSSLHCATQLVASQFERTIRIAEDAQGVEGMVVCYR